MGKTLADAMSAQPGPESLAYWLAPLQGYWDRQGRMAQDGLTMADQGAQSVRAGNMGGLAGLLLGPANYLASPINALFPERSEIEAAGDVPQWSKPLLAGGLEAMAVMAPGPKGSRLGKGLDELGDAATDAERLALQSRLEAEAGQTGGQAVATSRDQALRNLTEAPPKPKKRLNTQSYKDTFEDGTTEWVPGTLRVNPPKQVFEPEMTRADMERLGLDPNKTYTRPKRMNSASYKETYEDGTTAWVPGLLRAKRPPKK